MKKMHWDSDFWGVEIIHLDDSRDFCLDKIFDRPLLVQALPNINDLEFIQRLELLGFNFKESKITLQKNKFDTLEKTHSFFRKLSLGELNSFRNIFFRLYGKNSRFNIFSDDKVNEFYYTWMSNSIVGQMDDACIGYFIESKLAGFVTFRIRNSEVSIGLLGVLPEYQGRGVAQLILSYVDDVAIKNNINTVNVSTQGKNINALNAYIKNGYRIKSIEQWYYFIEGAIK